MNVQNTMMKKEYLEPTVEVVEFASEILMNTASGETGSAGTGEGSAGNNPELSVGHRGAWGNLWGED